MSTRRKPRRRPAHLTLVQKLPTRPPLHRRLLRMISTTSVAIACGLALLTTAAIYMTWPNAPHSSARLAEKQGNKDAKDNARALPDARDAHATHEAASAESYNRAHQLASTQQHVLMARVY